MWREAIAFFPWSCQPNLTGVYRINISSDGNKNISANVTEQHTRKLGDKPTQYFPQQYLMFLNLFSFVKQERVEIQKLRQGENLILGFSIGGGIDQDPGQNPFSEDKSDKVSLSAAIISLRAVFSSWFSPFVLNRIFVDNSDVAERNKPTNDPIKSEMIYFPCFLSWLYIYSGGF